MKTGASPEERREWIDRFKQLAPDNSLANSLSAMDYFKSGQKDLAVQEIVAASGKSAWQDYSRNSIQDAEEAYRTAGYSEADAKTIASVSLLMPQLIGVRQMGENLVDAANVYRQAGDSASAQTLLQMGARVGQEVADSGTPSVINDLVGIALQRIVLADMDPNAPYGDAGRTVQNRIDDLIQQRQVIQALARQSDGMLEQMSDEEIANYFDRSKSLGELDTLRWAANKHGQQ